MTRAESDARRDLLMIQAKYDGDGLPPALYSALKKIETEISWIQHKESLGGSTRIGRSAESFSARRPQAQA
jgi:hypothetical protein